MAWFDYLIIVLVGIPMVLGLKIGLVRVTANIFGIIGGIFLALRFSDQFIGPIDTFINDQQISAAISFFSVIVFTIFASWAAASFLKKVLSLLLLGWVDRVGGALFGAVLGSFIVGTIIFVMEISSLPGAADALSDSRLKSIFEFTIEFIEEFRTTGIPL
ncbi:MAG: CvpA family protein [Dehalococcoidia bacterium]|tara:strand:- start:735 stop:1214 length:480 start_codon:yes stop_codon:yes gene_type:complete